MTAKLKYTEYDTMPNSLFMDKLNEAKCVAVDILRMIAIDRLPHVKGHAVIYPYSTIKTAIMYTKHAAVVDRCKAYVDALMKIEMYFIPKDELDDILKTLLLKSKEAQKILNINLPSRSERKASELGSILDSPISKKTLKLDPIADTSPDRMVTILEKLIFEYSKGYPPTTLYHIDVLNIGNVFKIIGSFIIQPDMHLSSYLHMQEGLTGPAQSVFKSFTNLRAFMTYAFLMDSRVMPSAMLFSYKFNENMTAFHQLIAVSIMMHRPTTINSTAVNWLIDKIVTNDSTDDTIRYTAEDAIIRYIDMTNCDNAKMQASRCGLMCHLIRKVVGGSDWKEITKISALPADTPTAIKSSIIRQPSHEYVEDRSVKISTVNCDRRRPSIRSMCDDVDNRMMADIDHLDGHVDDRDILRDDDLRAYFIKSFVPFPKSAVIENLREQSMNIIRHLQSQPVPIGTLSASQRSQRTIREDNGIKTHIVANKFKLLIHRDDIPPEQKNTTSSLGLGGLRNSGKSLNALPKLPISSPTPQNLHPSTAVTSPQRHDSPILPSIRAIGQRQSSNHRKVNHHSVTVNRRVIDASVDRDRLKTIDHRIRRPSIMANISSTAVDKSKLSVVVMPAGSLISTTTLRPPVASTQPKGFFTKTRKVIDRAAPVMASRGQVDGSAARDYLACKASSAWTSTEVRLMTVVRRAISDELEKYERKAWISVISKCEEKCEKDEKQVFESICSEEIVKLLLQVGSAVIRFTW